MYVVENRLIKAVQKKLPKAIHIRTRLRDNKPKIDFHPFGKIQQKKEAFFWIAHNF